MARMLRAGDGSMSLAGTGASAGTIGSRHAQARRDAQGQGLVDVDQAGQHRLAHARDDALAELEHQGGDDVVLLRLGLAGEEQPRLGVVVGEGSRAAPAAARPPPALGKVR